MPNLPFPLSSTPGVLPGEGEGRLVNTLAIQNGKIDTWRRVPGASAFATASASGCRGMLDIEGVSLPSIIGAWANTAVLITRAGVVSNLGSLPGTKGVTFARNNRTTAGVSTPDIVAVREDGGAYHIPYETGVCSAFADVDLPSTVNSVDFLAGYFLFSNPDGRIFASELNAVEQKALSFATAESNADGLKRILVHANTAYAMGTRTIEPWLNRATSPFPLGKATSTIPVGLLTTMAVAGHEPGWGGSPTFVGDDGTVLELRGYETKRISTAAVERFIADSVPDTLEACVYVSRGDRIWALSSNAGTWEFNASTGRWHERATGSGRWTASKSVLANNRWYVGRTASAALNVIDHSAHTDAGTAIAMLLESGSLQDYPARTKIPHLFSEFARSIGGTVSMQYSLDGGATWSAARTRPLDAASKLPVRWMRLGMAGHDGLRVKFTISDAVDVVFKSASVPDPEPRRP
jgi:hypothetical protein